MDGILNTDTYYMEGIMTLGRGGRPGLAGAAEEDTLTSWKENTLV
jgi:hypothetical protein